MSRVVPDGVLGVSHYAYMAGAMARGLKEVVESGTLDAATFPQGVFHSAQEFFNSVRQRFEQKVPDDLLRTASDYSIAARALLHEIGRPFTIQAERTLLSRCAAFVDSLGRPRKLLPYEQELAATLAALFTEIERAGGDASYTTVVGDSSGMAK
jgi:hypothetical protein